MLEVRGLQKRYGDLSVLRDVFLDVEPGRSVGFLGANGAGKTTTMRSLFGLVEPDAGTICWSGKVVVHEQRMRFGYMPEQRGLYAGMKVGEQLVYLARLHGLTKTAATKACAHWLERLGLSDRVADPVEKLSHGNQQRVQLAAALLHEPVLLVLDEPFSGLDPIGVDNMKDILRQETERGAAVLFSSHQLELVEEVCDDVAILHQGHIALHGDLGMQKAAAGIRRVVVGGPTNGAWTTSAPGFIRHDYNQISASHTFLVSDTISAAEFLSFVQDFGSIESYSYTPPSLEDLYRETVR